MRRLWNFVADNWRASASYVLATVALVAFFSFRLKSSLPQFSQAEINSRIASSSLSMIADNPLDAPYKILQYGFLKLGLNGVLAMRLVSVVLAVIAVWLFYVLILKWHTRRVAILASILFATSSLFTHAARTATPAIMLCSLLAVTACGYLIRYGRGRFRAWLLAAAVLALSMYVPIIVVFIVLGGIWQAKPVLQSLNRLKPGYRAVCVLLFGIILTPLVISMVRTPDLLRSLIGLPNIAADFLEIAKHTLSVPLALFIRTPNAPDLWLGRLPILDLFASVMFAFGAYAYAFKLKLHRTQIIIAILLLVGVLVSLSGQWQYILILLPFVYIVVAAGITLMLQQWFTVFPRNPLARVAGTLLIVMAIVMASGYQVIRQYIAWPNNKHTKTIYSHKP